MMLSIYLDNSIVEFNKQLQKIKKDKPKVIALQGAPHLSEEDLSSQVLMPLDNEYLIFRGDILHKLDNLLLIKRGTHGAKKVSDTSANDWMLKSNVSLCGVILGPNGLGLEANENQFKQAIFSVYVEPGDNLEGDIINNAYYIRKILASEKLSSSNLVLLCDYVAEAYVKLFERILEIDIDVGSRRTRSTRRRSNGT